MTQKVYKTAQGKTVDMGRLMLQNEQVRAVGNMKINARGDIVDDMNNIISSKPQQVNNQYNKQVQTPKGNA
jgi:glycine cleavage system H lipoate-binding protein